MRPKSIATVVVVLAATWVTSSTVLAATVIAASVVSGMISDTAPTNVVFPTPKPPATMIFADWGGRRAGPGPVYGSESAYAIDQPLGQGDFGVHAGALGDVEQTLLHEVADEDPDHPERQPELGGDLGERVRHQAEGEDLLVLGAARDALAARAGGAHGDRLDGKRAHGAASRQHERSDHLLVLVGKPVRHTVKTFFSSSIN